MIKKIPDKLPKSPQTFIDLLRLHLDIAFDEKLSYLEISYKKVGDPTVKTITIQT